MKKVTIMKDSYSDEVFKIEDMIKHYIHNEKLPEMLFMMFINDKPFISKVLDPLSVLGTKK